MWKKEWVHSFMLNAEEARKKSGAPKLAGYAGYRAVNETGRRDGFSLSRAYPLLVLLTPLKHGVMNGFEATPQFGQ